LSLSTTSFGYRTGSTSFEEWDGATVGQLHLQGPRPSVKLTDAPLTVCDGQ
jgi:hypothetical protein